VYRSGAKRQTPRENQRVGSAKAIRFRGPGGAVSGATILESHKLGLDCAVKKDSSPGRPEISVGLDMATCPDAVIACRKPTSRS
jgi:hypothetical protein